MSVAGIALALLQGCGRPQVEVYNIPHMPPRLNAPDHWRAVATSTMMEAEKQRYEITLILEDRNATALATLTVLPGKGSQTREAYLRLNVNRWRGQLQLEALTADDELENHLAPVAGLPKEARMVDVSGTSVRSPFGPARTVGVMIPRVNALWVYKLSGDPQVVAREREAFLKLLPEWQ
jgi:hypothetical protein